MITSEVDTDREPSLTQLVTGILHDTEELMTQQLQLVKVEVKNDLHRYIRATIPMIAGAFAGVIGAIVLAFAIAHALLAIWPTLPVWAAYAIVGGGLALAGTLVVVKCANQFAAVKLLDQTAAGVKENIQWKTKS